MPSGQKNQKYFNRHAAEARERQAERAAEAKSNVKKATEDAQWADDGDKVAQRRKERELAELEKERERERARREASEQLQAEEAQAVKGAVPSKVSKRAQQKEMAKLLAQYNKDVERTRGATLDEDANQREMKKRAEAHEARVKEKLAPHSKAVAATSVEEEEEQRTTAQSNTTNGGGGSGKKENLDLSTVPVMEDRVLGKRARVLYKQFVAEELPALKAERPGMRRTQYNDLLWAKWQKSPQNPFVVRAEAMAYDSMLQERTWMQQPSSSSGDEEDDEEEAKKKVGDQKKGGK